MRDGAQRVAAERACVRKQRLEVEHAVLEAGDEADRRADTGEGQGSTIEEEAGEQRGRAHPLSR